MFKKQYRYSFGKGLPKKTVDTSLFIFKYHKNDEGLHCAVVVRKKIDKRATVRNRLKRKFVSIVKELVKNRDIPYDMVFFLKKEIMERDNKHIEEIVRDVLKKAKIL